MNVRCCMLQFPPVNPHQSTGHHHLLAGIVSRHLCSKAPPEYTVQYQWYLFFCILYVTLLLQYNTVLYMSRVIYPSQTWLKRCWFHLSSSASYIHRQSISTYNYDRYLVLFSFLPIRHLMSTLTIFKCAWHFVCRALCCYLGEEFLLTMWLNQENLQALVTRAEWYLRHSLCLLYVLTSLWPCIGF